MTTPSNPATEAPTPGAASDSFDKLIAQLRNGDLTPANRADDHDLADRIERLAAPVTEGAQRGAVAFRWRFTDHKKWHAVAGDPPQSLLNDSYYTVELLYPPPPDRVQPERVEAETIPEWAIEKARRYFDTDPDDGTLEQRIQERAASYVRDLAAMHECKRAAPPTDASGGVTDAMAKTVLRAYHRNDWDRWDQRSQTRSIADMRAALEAADRARKPGYRQVTLEDARAIDRYAKSWDKSSPREENDDTCLMVALQHIGAVVPDTAQGASGQQAQPE